MEKKERRSLSVLNFAFILLKVLLKGCKLSVKLCGNTVADLLIELLDACDLFLPEILVNVKQTLKSLLVDIKTLDVDVLRSGNITDGSLNCIYLALATSDDPKKNTHIVTEAGPDEVTLIVGTEPVNVEYLGSLGDLLAHCDPVTEVVTHIVTGERKHCHRIAANYTDSAGSGCGSLGCHDRTNEYTVLPVSGFVYKGSSLSTAAAEYDSGNGNTVNGVELRGDAGAVSRRSGETAVGVSTLYAAIGIPNLAGPVHCILGRILVETFPPNGIVLKVVNNVGEDGALSGGSKSVGVRLIVGTGSNTEEAVLGVNSPKSAVLTDTDPSDIVTYAPYLIALLCIDLRRNEHCKVGLTASGGECGGDILDLSLGSLDAEDEHMLSHPALFSAEVGCDTKRKTLLTEKNVSAVTGVNGPDSVILGEMTDITVLLVKLSLGVETLDEAGIIAESLKNVSTYTGHDAHVEYNVDRVGKLDTVFSKGRAYNTHGIRNNVHGSALHGAAEKLGKLSVAVSGSHPVIDVTCILLLGGTDKGSALYTGNVVNCGSVKIAVRKKLLIELDDLTGGHSLSAKSVKLCLRSVYPDDLVRLSHFSHLIDPTE